MNTADFHRLKWRKLAGFSHKFRLRCLPIHAHTIETGWCSHNVITAQVKTECRIQIDFEFQGTNFGGYIAFELSFMGSIAYFDKHSVWIRVCEIAYNFPDTNSVLLTILLFEINFTKLGLFHFAEGCIVHSRFLISCIVCNPRFRKGGFEKIWKGVKGWVYRFTVKKGVCV